MKLVKFVIAVLSMFGSVAFAFDIPGLGGQSVHIDSGKVTVTGKNGDSVSTDGSKVGVTGKSGDSVSTDGEKVDVKRKYGRGVSVPAGAGKNNEGKENK